MTHKGYDLNEHGVMFSRHVCDVCGQPFELLPAIHGDDTCGRPPGLDGPGDPGCVSYDVRRDVDRLLADGGALVAVDTPKRGES